MGLKQIIKERKILASGAVDAELELPGEPMIYSVKYNIANRTRSVQFFRDMKWKSLLKSFFRSYYNTNIPVVVVVRFYVSPPSYVNVKQADLHKESVPAVHSFEVCDYLLSFLEMLHHVLINSYRQVVKVDTEKFYSANPRTVFQFMKWEHYVKLQGNHTIHPQGQELGSSGQVQPLQSKRKRNAQNTRVCQEPTEGQVSATVGSSACDSALQDAGAAQSTWEEAPTAASPTACQAPRWRQPGKVPKR